MPTSVCTIPSPLPRFKMPSKVFVKSDLSSFETSVGHAEEMYRAGAMEKYSLRIYVQCHPNPS